MKAAMKGRAVLAVVLGLVVVLLAWNMFFFAPAGNDLADAKDDRDLAETELAGLDARLESLRDLEEQQPEMVEEQARLGAMIPERPDLEVFIRAANDISVDSGIDWISVAPSEPAAGASGVSEIRMAIQLQGGYYQVQDYLNRLEDLSRLVVIDSIQVGTGVDATDEQSIVPSAGGAPSLSVTLTARMFTQATGLVSAPVVPDAGATTTTVADNAATTEQSGVGGLN